MPTAGSKLPAAVAAAALSAASVLNLSLAEGRLARPYDVTHVPSSRAARIAALGNRTFLSDLYWLDAVQYIGEPKADARGWQMLHPLIDLVTDLDPRHAYAYQTAGIVLSAAGRIDESNSILEKGVAAGLERWTFPFYLSFNHWFYQGDVAAGARWAEVAARMPGASANISQLAVALASKSGAPAEVIPILEELRRGVQDEATAARLDEQLKLAIVERDAQALERAAARFREERGRPIASLAELVQAGYASAIPPDPFGGRYLWSASEGRVHSSANAFRFSRPSGSSAANAPRFEYQPPPSEVERMP